MSPNEREWESLTDVWRADAQPVDRAPLDRLWASHRRRVIAVVTGEAGLVTGFAWLSWLAARDGVAPWEAVWLSTLWTCTAIAAAFAWWTRGRAWRALGESVAEFRRLRAARRAQAMRFAVALFAFEVALVVAQLAWFDRFTPLAASLLAASAVVMAAWYVWMRGRIAGDLGRASSDEP